MKFSKLIIASIVTGLAASPMVMAQVQQQQQQEQQQQQQPMPQEQPEPIEVEEADLEAFADAYIEISDLREEYTERLQAAEDQEAAHELQQEANQAMTAAIEDAGLDIQDYQEIATALSADPDLRDRVTELVAERR
jgi:uncharacterized iron-regulated membrane protein